MKPGKRTLRIYRDDAGREPFADWLESLDRTTRARVAVRLDRLELGNPGDCRAVGGGVSELRLHFGAGYRVCFGEVDDEIVLLLAGGSKATQKRDIARARKCWRQHKE